MFLQIYFFSIKYDQAFCLRPYFTSNYLAYLFQYLIHEYIFYILDYSIFLNMFFLEFFLDLYHSYFFPIFYFDQGSKVWIGMVFRIHVSCESQADTTTHLSCISFSYKFVHELLNMCPLWNAKWPLKRRNSLVTFLIKLKTFSLLFWNISVVLVLFCLKQHPNQDGSSPVTDLERSIDSSTNITLLSVDSNTVWH